MELISIKREGCHKNSNYSTHRYLARLTRNLGVGRAEYLTITFTLDLEPPTQALAQPCRHFTAPVLIPLHGQSSNI